MIIIIFEKTFFSRRDTIAYYRNELIKSQHLCDIVNDVVWKWQLQHLPCYRLYLVLPHSAHSLASLTIRKEKIQRKI